MVAVKTTRLDALPPVAVAVGVGVEVGVAVAVGVVAVGVGVAVAVGVAVVAVGVGVVVALVVVGDAVGLAEVFVADGLGDGAVAWRGSHDSLPPVVAAEAAAVPAVAARMPHEAAVSRTLPVTSVTAVPRAYANHIKRPRLY
jgi:hypothetical protein